MTLQVKYNLLVDFSRDLAYSLTGPKTKVGDEGRGSVVMRAGKFFLLIGLLVLCALLFVFFIAIKGEENTVPLTTSTTDKK